MSDKQHYIRLDYEFGVDNGDGTFEMKNEGKFRYVSLPIEAAVALEARAFVPAMKLILDEVAALGVETFGDGSSNVPPGQAKK